MIRSFSMPNKVYTELFPIEIRKDNLAKIFEAQFQKGLHLTQILPHIEKEHLEQIRTKIAHLLNHEPNDGDYIQVIRMIEEIKAWLELLVETRKGQQSIGILPENESEALDKIRHEFQTLQNALKGLGQTILGKRTAQYAHLEKIYENTLLQMEEMTISRSKKIFLDFEKVGAKKYARILETFQTYFAKLRGHSAQLISFIRGNIFHWDAQVLKTGRGLYIPKQDDLPCSILFTAHGQAHFIFENVGQLLGSGADKVVVRTFSIPDGKIAALIKPLWIEEEEHKQKRAKNRFEDIWLEMQILSQVKNKRGIVSLNERLAFKIDEELTLFLLEDFYWDGNLWNYLKYPIHLKIAASKFSNSLLQELFTDLLSGLVAIHQEGIIHHDIKPDNILLDLHKKESKAVLADFQLAAYMNDTHRIALLRCIPQWTTPELAKVIINENHTPEDYIAATSDKTDIWSMGLTFYCLIASKLPSWMRDEKKHQFADLVNVIGDNEGMDAFSKIAKLKKGWLPKSLQRSPFFPLLEKMLDPNPKKRCSAEEALKLICFK